MNVTHVRKLRLATLGLGSSLTAEDRHAERELRALIGYHEQRMSDDFVLAIARIRNKMHLDDFEEIIASGDIQVINDESSAVEEMLVAALLLALLGGGRLMNDMINEAQGSGFSFSPDSPRIDDLLSQHRIRIAANFNSGQIKASVEALLSSIKRGDSLRDRARALRDSIGLTESQVKAVNSYRTALQNLSSTALNRSLRDQSLDGMVTTAINDGQPLSQKQINTLVRRYRQQQLRYRANKLAQAEATRAVHQGMDEMLEQSVSAGQLRAGQIERTWRNRQDSKVRDSHSTMHGQKKGIKELFLSGAGNYLRYPHDPGAPIAETANCRCVLVTRILPE